MWQRWNQSTHIFEKSTDNGGSWTPLGLNASIITEGTLPDARLSSNVALKGSTNVFTAAQSLVASDARIILTQDNARFNYIQATNYGLDIMNNVYYDTVGNNVLPRPAAPSWIVRLSHTDNFTIFRAPAGSVGYSQLFSVGANGSASAAGPIYERSRGYFMGQRQSWVPAIYTAEGAVVTPGSITAAYCVIGDILFWSVYLVNFNNPGAGTPYIRFTVPAPYTPALGDQENSAIRIYVPGIGDAIGFSNANSSGGYPGFIFVYRAPSIGWPAGVGHIIGEGHYFIA